MSGASPVLSASRAWIASSGAIGSGTFHLGVPYDSHWKLSVGGDGADFGASFGSVMAAVTPRAGTAVLEYERPVSRVLWLLAQCVVWVLVVLGVTQPRRLRRRVGTPAALEPVMVLGGSE